ncbi:MAG: NAD-dependent epimerase/dehydratase family protein, partial [Gammaproteobacteria bacterium]|nr:NAD-dependent epimerase/dehydratase family protein [Gammaproteobacteria bacterium]
GWSKLAAERMLADFHLAHGLRSVALRYFNAAGADPEAETGEHHEPETHLIPLVLDAALGKRPEITVFGGDYPTPDGTCIRDYIHVSDLADAHVLALDWLGGNDAAAAFNLGNGRGFSVREVIDCARRITGCPIEMGDGPRRDGDPPALVGDAGRARAELGWMPRYTDLDVIVETAWRWHRDRFGAAPG